MADGPARILITPEGSAGDVHPLVAIGAELRRRGHDVRIAVADHFADTARLTGAPVDALDSGHEWQDFVESHRSLMGIRGPAEILRRLRQDWGEAARFWSERSLPVARAFGPDLVLGNSICFHGRLAAETLGAEWVGTLFSPSALLSAHDPPELHCVPSARWWVPPLRRLRHACIRRLLAAAIDPPINDLRRDLGLPPVRDAYFGWMIAGAPTLCLFPTALRRARADDPDSLIPCGVVFNDASGEHGDLGRHLDPAVDGFIRAGDPPVIVSLGTIHAQARTDIADLAVAAAQRIGRRAVVVTGADGPPAIDERAGMCRVGYAPHSELLHRGALTVHHGGAGTLAQSIRARRPMIVTPIAHDQFDHAARARRLGVAAARPARRVTTGWLAHRMRGLIDDPRVRSRIVSLADAVDREDGLTNAADAVERIAGARAPAAGRTLLGSGAVLGR